MVPMDFVYVVKVCLVFTYLSQQTAFDPTGGLGPKKAKQKLVLIYRFWMTQE